MAASHTRNVRPLGWALALAPLLVLAATPVADARPIIYSPGIKIEGSEAFVGRTRQALNRLRQTPTGRKLIAAMARTRRTTTITEIHEPNGWANPRDGGGSLRPDGSPGRGTDSTIGWNPRFAPGGLPAAVILGHELVHAWHMARGVTDFSQHWSKDTEDPDIGTPIEEMNTVGMPPYDKQNPLSENAIRRDWNRIFGTKLPMRKTYASLHTPKPYEPAPEIVETDPVLDEETGPSKAKPLKYRGASGALGRLGG